VAPRNYGLKLDMPAFLHGRPIDTVRLMGRGAFCQPRIENATLSVLQARVQRLLRLILGNTVHSSSSSSSSRSVSKSPISKSSIAGSESAELRRQGEDDPKVRLLRQLFDQSLNPKDNESRNHGRRDGGRFVDLEPLMPGGRVCVPCRLVRKSDDGGWAVDVAGIQGTIAASDMLRLPLHSSNHQADIYVDTWIKSACEDAAGSLRLTLSMRPLSLSTGSTHSHSGSTNKTTSRFFIDRS
jgi:hypothetical protein